MYCALLSVLLFVAVNAAPQWDGLRVTWSPDPLNKWAFNSLPRDLSSAGSEFTLRDNQCETNGARFLGQRYWYQNDPALTLLFDNNGIIAGIQTSVPKASYNPSNYLSNRNYVDDGDFWSLTAYFVDPRTICESGRTTEQLQVEGTGTGLWLQVGPNPVHDTVKIPMTEQAVRESDWTFGKCFPSMGNHYWFNVTQNMSCGKFIPNCLLYNKGILTAFCFTTNANLQSDRYEHPTASDTRMFLQPVPDCFFTDPSYNPLSTIHVYMVDNARVSSRC